MKRLDPKRQNELEPKRIEFAKQEIEKLGYEVTVQGKQLTFMHNSQMITFFPYSGWASGKGIEAGRGLQNLLKQLK